MREETTGFYLPDMTICVRVRFDGLAPAVVDPREGGHHDVPQIVELDWMRKCERKVEKCMEYYYDMRYVCKLAPPYCYA